MSLQQVREVVLEGSPQPVVTMTGVTIANGRGVANGGTLTLDHSVVKKSADIGILTGGSLTLDNSTVSNNATEPNGAGAGILNRTRGTVTLTNSTVSENEAAREPEAPPGIFGEGGGIYNERGGTVTLTNTTISKNFAGDGGGIYNENGGTLTLNNSDVTRNTAEEKGGGIYNNATVVGTNDTIAGNTAPKGAGIFNEPPGEVSLKNSKVQSP